VQIIVRDFRGDDFDQLWEIDQHCFPAGIAYSKAELMHYIRRPSAFTIVSEVDHSITGFVVGEVIRQRGHLITLDVLEPFRRQALGSKLMLAAEQRLCEKQCLAVFLETAVDNVAAISFYNRHGYVVVKTIPRYYQGKVDALLMGKKLISEK
jgi:[ribosomal protein S18]-alanine N-acetyltransferase